MRGSWLGRLTPVSSTWWFTTCVISQTTGTGWSTMRRMAVARACCSSLSRCFGLLKRFAARAASPPAVVLMSPQGRRFSHDAARRLAGLSHVVVLCGRYEGVDERVRERLVTDEVSIGDYVLTGGELPALVMLDAVTRLLPGAVGDVRSVEGDSFVRGLLDHPHYTRPSRIEGLEVPDVLQSGDHGAIRRWRKRESLRRTIERRPELLAPAQLDDEERELLGELIEEQEEGAPAHGECH